MLTLWTIDFVFKLFSLSFVSYCSLGSLTHIQNQSWNNAMAKEDFWFHGLNVQYQDGLISPKSKKKRAPVSQQVWQYKDPPPLKAIIRTWSRLHVNDIFRARRLTIYKQWCNNLSKQYINNDITISVKCAYKQTFFVVTLLLNGRPLRPVRRGGGVFLRLSPIIMAFKRKILRLPQY